MKINLQDYLKKLEKSAIFSKTDETGVILKVNRAFCKVSGYSKKELLGKKHGILRHPDMSKSAFRKARKKKGDAKPYKIIFKNLTKSGETLYLDTLIVPILNERGEIAEYASFSYDVSKFFEARDELINAKRTINEMNANFEKIAMYYQKNLYTQKSSIEAELRENFQSNEKELRQIQHDSLNLSIKEALTNLSHQWRQPLNELGIALFELKNKRVSEGEFSDKYALCKDLVKQMSKSIDDFANSLQSPVLSAFSLLEVVREVRDINFELFAKFGAHFEIEGEDFEILGVRDDLMRVFYTLFMNAIDAYGKKKNKIIFIKTAKFGKNFAKISVKDKAGGIVFLDKVFQPFFTTKYPTQGAGLDLYFSKQMLENMGAQIKVSNDKKGACFNIFLKLNEEK